MGAGRAAVRAERKGRVRARRFWDELEVNTKDYWGDMSYLKLHDDGCLVCVFVWKMKC